MNNYTDNRQPISIELAREIEILENKLTWQGYTSIKDYAIFYGYKTIKDALKDLGIDVNQYIN